MQFEIIHENKDFIVVNKPSGMLSVPDRMQSEPSLKDLLRQKYESIYSVHRLDKATSGLIIFARDPETHKTLSRLFETREVKKYYLGLIEGYLLPAEGVIETGIMEHPQGGKMINHIKGKASKTAYQTQEVFKGYSLVRFRIYTGRTHQIRVHCQYLGHTIVADPIYGEGKALLLSSVKKKFNLSKKELEERPIMGRLALHAHQISFRLNDSDYDFEAPLSKDLQATLTQLRKHAAVQRPGVSPLKGENE